MLVVLKCSIGVFNVVSRSLLPGEGRNVLLLSCCFYPSLQLLLPVLEADIFPDQNTPLSPQSAPEHIISVEVTAKNGESFCNSHLVYLDRKGRVVKTNQG